MKSFRASYRADHHANANNAYVGSFYFKCNPQIDRSEYRIHNKNMGARRTRADSQRQAICACINPLRNVRSPKLIWRIKHDRKERKRYNKKTEAPEQKLDFDGAEYDLNSLSDGAINQLVNLQTIDQKVFIIATRISTFSTCTKCIYQCIGNRLAF